MIKNSLTSSRVIVALCVCLFALSFAVRIIVWQNNKVDMAGVQYVLTQLYEADGRTLIRGDIAEFVTGDDPPSDATVLLHPPGYAIFIAFVYAAVGEADIFRIVQIGVNSIASVLVFLTAMRLFDRSVALTAGVLVSLAPQFAYHSATVLPDGLAVLPILLALYFLIRSVQDDHAWTALACGVSIGLSCWFRSNALLLPVFFAVSLALVLPRDKRLRLALMLLAGFIITIAPITIRNYVVFGAFIPLSVGMGTTFVEGLGDYDKDGSKGMPSTDEGVMEMDARLAGRPDYIGNLYDPDGVLRERRRIAVGLAIVRSHPVWYLASVAHRGLSTLRMERVPAIAPEHDERETTHPVFYYLNAVLKLVQRTFITAIVLPLFLLGVFIAARYLRDRSSLILLTVPLYYMTVQALIHTEYRYVLATPHIMMVFCAVAVVFIFKKIAGRVSDRYGLPGTQ